MLEWLRSGGPAGRFIVTDRLTQHAANGLDLCKTCKASTNGIVSLARSFLDVLTGQCKQMSGPHA